MKAVVPEQIYTSQVSGVLTTTTNNANYYVLSNGLQTASDYANLFTATGLTGVATNATQVDLESSSIHLRLINQDNFDCHVTLHCIMPRIDIPGNYPSIQTTMQNGFTTAGIPGTPSTDLRSTLFMSKDLMEMYKVVHVNKFVMMPGQEKRFLFTSKPRRVNKTFADSTHWTAFRGYSKYFIVRVEGSVANDSTNKSNVGTSAAKIDYVETERYVYRYVTPLTTNYVMNGTLGTITVPESIQQDAGVVAVEAQA